MERCEVCGLVVHSGGQRCFHCVALDEAFRRLVCRNPEAAERWATSKQIQAALWIGRKVEANHDTDLG